MVRAIFGAILFFTVISNAQEFNRSPIILTSKSETSKNIIELTKKVTVPLYEGNKLLALLNETTAEEEALSEALDSEFAKRAPPDFDDKIMDIVTGQHELSPIAQYIAEPGDGDPLYTKINRSLRSGKKLSKGLADFVAKFEGALDKIPSVHALSYRGAIYSKKVTSAYLPGSTLAEKGYFSTSVSLSVAKKFLVNNDGRSGKPVLYVIYGENGKSISQINPEYQGEAEILYRKNTNFCVTGRSTPATKEEVLIVLLREVKTDCSELN
ncbi:ADP-ribosyltransferase [Bdellovibrio sp. HCB-110]|uniref:ADP-ribosyltransferase n=1 Tax=Bdellovibrio sp. HCB-110 TaxID=3391182 RepID=UPI0039B48072